MTQSNSQKVFKTILIAIIQIIFIGSLAYIITNNNQFQQQVNLQLKCVNLNPIRRYCISIYQRNNTAIPHNKGIQAVAKYSSSFKVLQFRQKGQRLKKMNKDSYLQYFYLTQFNENIQTIDDIKLETGIQAINAYLTLEKATFRNKKYQKLQINPQVELAVFYLVQPLSGPIKYETAIKIIYPNRNSILINNKFSIIQTVLGLLGVIIYSILLLCNNKINFAQFKNSQIGSKLNRVFQFLLNFGMNHVIYLVTLHQIWKQYDLGFVDQTLQLSQNVIPRYQANAYDSVILMFPQWLMIAFVVYQILQRYSQLSSIPLLIASGLSAAVLYILPTPFFQFIFSFNLAVSSLFLASYTKVVSNNKFTITFLLSVFCLITMVAVKILWFYVYNSRDDFVIRFFYNQIFISFNFISMIIHEDQPKTKQHRQYIPYDQTQLEEEQS